MQRPTKGWFPRLGTVLLALLAGSIIAALQATPAQAAATRSATWPSTWSPPLGGNMVAVTTNYGAFDASDATNVGCPNADTSNDYTYYLIGGRTEHLGVDLDSTDGDSVYSIGAGIVKNAGTIWGTASKEVLIIEHTTGSGEKFIAAYGHIAIANNPATGQEWKAGDSVAGNVRIGNVSTAGTGAHLHFGIEPGTGTYVDPTVEAPGTGDCAHQPMGTVDPMPFLDDHPTTTPPPAPPAGPLASSAAVVYDGAQHTFYYDATGGNLRHAWWTGSAWSFETFDGDGGPGQISGDVGSRPTAVVYNDQLHVFYYDATGGNLRHAWWVNTVGHWSFETFDGDGSPGRIGGDAGKHPRAVVYNGQLHTFYYDATGGNLRHAWWSGSSWSFETFDGNGTSAGRVNDNVGQYPTVMVLGSGGNAAMHIFYYNVGAGDLRHAWYANSTTPAAIETLDGNSNVGGRVNADAGSYATTAVYDGQPHVFYYDATGGNLRHAWWNIGNTAWSFEDLDGSSVANGRLNANVGAHANVVVYNNQVHVFYYDATGGNLRHTWWTTGIGWSYATPDGATGTEGGLNADVGQYARAVVDGNALHVYYYDSTGGNVRHAWWPNATSAGLYETFDGAPGSPGGLDANVL